MTVYVIQDDGRKNFSKAQKFGNLVPMIHSGVFPDDAIERVETITRILTAKLKEFNPLNDYLLLTGDPLAILISALVLSGMGIFSFSCLKWDREEKSYYPVTVNT